MKKTLAVLAFVLAMVFALSACGGAASSSEPTPTPEPVSQAEPASTPEPAPDPEPTFDTSRNISVIAREDGSGTKTAFMELIGLKGMPDPSGVVIQTGTAAILAEVQGNPTAIAYESLGYVTPDVKPLKVDGVEATVENIKAGSYGISRPLAIVYQEANLEDELNKAFYDFLASADAQALISEGGYVSIVDGAAAYTPNEALSGTIDVSGSTSLQPLMIELAAAFETLQPSVTVNVSGGGSGTGYENAEGGVSAFGMISEEFNVEKAPSCVNYVVCKDGIAVIVNPENPLEDVSMEQIKAIYDAEAGDAAITTWDALIA